MADANDYIEEALDLYVELRAKLDEDDTVACAYGNRDMVAAILALTTMLRYHCYYVVTD